MDDDEVLIVMWYLRRRSKQNKKRKYWVHPLLAERFSLGTFQILIGELRSDESKFFNYFRMSMSSFDDLVARVKTSIKIQNTTYRDCICPEERLAITLRYLASGCSFRELHYNYRVGLSTISKIIKEMSIIIWNVLFEDYLMLPDTEVKWSHIANGFEKKGNFPHCLGAIDGKHIRVVKPKNSGSMYFNYKDYFSFVLLAIVDSEYRFIYVNIGSYGKECDSTILKETVFWQKLNDGTVNIPEPRPLHETSEEQVPFVFIGDEGFSLTPNLLRPYGGTHLDEKKKVFNYRLSRARRYVECAFGILANKWRILHRPMDLHPETAVEVVKACTALHNFVREKDGFNYEDVKYTTSVEVSKQPHRDTSIPRGGPRANAIRSTFAEYFVSRAGSIPWQTTAMHAA